MRTFRVYAPELVNSGKETIENAKPKWADVPGDSFIEYVEIRAEGIGDEYHTMHELYQSRLALNVALFNYISHQRDHLRPFFMPFFILEVMDAIIPRVFKSKLHSDGTMFDGYFIVMMIRPNGEQISFHYDLKHWDEFKIPVVERCPQYDGHNIQDVIKRLKELA